MSQTLSSSAPSSKKRKLPPTTTTTTTAIKPTTSSLTALKTPQEIHAAYTQYGRGRKINLHGVRDKKLKTSLQKLEYRYRDAALRAKDAEVLMGEQTGVLEAEGMERSWKFTQGEVRGAVDLATAQKGFELKLPTFGPYALDYTRNGRYLLLGGRKGHVAAFDWREGKLGCEIQLGETIRDVKWLHNEQFFAVAQKKYTYIYDHQGVEIHCLKKHAEVTHMEFLPYHFLLATIGNAGWLKYQDTSTGDLISEHRTKLGVPSSLTQNPHNAILHVGHSNGSVTLWSPNMGTPLVRILTNRGPVRALAVDRGGYYMATAGADSRMNIFDIRTYKQLHSYYTPSPASTLDISDTGLLGVGWGPHVTIWKDALKTKQRAPYMTHLQESNPINDLRFCPFDDILGAGHAGGFSSLIIPGSGEANFDAREVNPYQTTKQRQETEVRELLDKLKPEMISLDPGFVGMIDAGAAQEEREERGKRMSEEEKIKNLVVKNKQRGRNSALKRHLRKVGKGNVIDERRVRLEELKKKKSVENEGKKVEELGPALARFAKVAK